MWTRRSLFLYTKIALAKGKRRLHLAWPLALYTLYQLLLSLDAAAGLVPGRGGSWLRGATDTLQALALELMDSQPQSLADIDVADKQATLRVYIATRGFTGGGQV